MPEKVLIVQPIAKEGIQMLKDYGAEIVKASSPDFQTLSSLIPDCDGLLVRTVPIPAELIKLGKRLKVIARHGVGVDNIDVETATERGIFVVNGPESNLEAVVEHILGFMIVLSKWILKADRALREGCFNVRDEYIGRELKGKTLGIIGVGRIGSALGVKAKKCFNMEVMGFDPFVTQDQIPADITLMDDWDAILKESDFISINCPLNDKTRGLISKDEFEKMKNNAFLVNASRGEIVDENALINALENGLIGGAATDVFEQEPPSKDNPLFDLDNVVVTPHMAAHTREAMVKMATDAAKGIIEVFEGKVPQNLVNREVLKKDN